MTVTYTAQVATCSGLGCFWKLLFRWQGSIYKLLWPNLVVYVLLYYVLYFVYLFALDESQKRLFEIVSKYCLEYSDLIPLSFVLGFYVNLVVKRWWEMFQFIPSTDTLAIFVSNSIPGQDDRCRLMRRTIMRYVNLSYVMILSMVSTRVKKRFPTLDHLVDAGVMLPNEKKIFDDLNARSRYSKFWMPLVWAGAIVTRARREGRIRDDFAVKTILDELCSFRSKCGALNGYDWVPVPLVYTQVVTLAVYTFFMATLMGRQLVGEQKDLYIPIFAFLQFFFYMGWLKVAESLVNPFGEDDDDFETNWLIDRNLQVSYLIVDEMHNEHPELIRDQYWDDILPQELPHTMASQPFRTSPHLGSTAHLEMTAYDADIFPTGSQLHKLDEESEETSDDDLVPEDDGGESGLPASEKSPRKKVRRQISVSDQSEPPNSFQSTSRLRISRKPSVLSVFQKVFTRENTMGSNISIASAYGRKPGFNRSFSRYSTTGVSRPHSPVQFGPQEDIFKMSDLSIDSESSTQNGGTSQTKPISSNITHQTSVKNLNEKRGKFGKNLSVEEPAASFAQSDTEDEPLLTTTAPTPPVPVTTSAQSSPLSKHKQFFPPKSSPKLLPKSTTSPQDSPKTTRMPPVAFFMGSDASQTDRASSSKGPSAASTEVLLVKLAEVEDLEEEVAEESNTASISSGSTLRPTSIPARTHKDSLREVSELEPIDEQSERLDSTSLEDA